MEFVISVSVAETKPTYSLWSIQKPLSYPLCPAGVSRVDSNSWDGGEVGGSIGVVNQGSRGEFGGLSSSSRRNGVKLRGLETTYTLPPSFCNSSKNCSAILRLWPLVCTSPDADTSSTSPWGNVSDLFPESNLLPLGTYLSSSSGAAWDWFGPWRIKMKASSLAFCRLKMVNAYLRYYLNYFSLPLLN